MIFCRIPSLLGLVLLVAGCATPYTIVHDLDTPVGKTASFAVTSIADNLRVDIDPADRPTQEQMDRLRSEIAAAIEDLDEIQWSATESAMAADYEIRGRLVDFAPGNGLLRFLVGFGAGSARITIVLELYSAWDDRVIFTGRYEDYVVSWAEGGDAMYARIAKAFAQHIEDQQEKLREGTSR